MGLKFAPAPLSSVYGMTWLEPVTLTDKLTGLPIDLTSCTLLMRIRERLTDTTHLLELKTEDGTLTVTDALNGKFQISVTKEAMQVLPDPAVGTRRKKVYVYDLTIIRGATHEPGISGKFTLRGQVTRAWQPT